MVVASIIKIWSRLQMKLFVLKPLLTLKEIMLEQTVLKSLAKIINHQKTPKQL